MASLPLFPLGTTLLPGGQLPLKVFEPRYVVMLRDLLAEPREEPGFGVVAIRRGFEVGVERANDLHGIGCFAELDQIAEIAEAVFFVHATGSRRFRLDSIDTAAGTPYLMADVTWLEERDGDPATFPALATRLRAAVTAYREVQDLEEAEAPTDPTELSYWAAPAAGLGAGDRQLLLACGETSARLGLALRMVQREAALTQSLGVVGLLPGGPASLN
ncbi:LON peptidase substrate-binding domain-containing protein [Lapillicoccus sp.]|uniref:LON peptidase substrate-binding domain-containing protein n=1 Tax=Lapillicoccus sp. TaxID=1909287 RepID=UPI003983069A